MIATQAASTASSRRAADAAAPVGRRLVAHTDDRSCHDITTYPAIGLAAGACEGNGLLLDISDPANPVRIDAVSDNNYAYWHGATFSNDGKTVVFTDEWGGGTAARCRATDDLSWGADAIYDIVDNKLVFRSYYKLPVAQTVKENCVSHLPSVVPVPGRDIITQAWYQGGLSVIDFTDSAHPKEIAYYDRGPIGAPLARARRPLVDLLLQRRHLRLRDRPRLRRVEADADRGAVGERDQGGERGGDDSADTAAPAAVHLGAELRRRALAPRPARAGRHDRDENPQAGEKFISSAEDFAARDKPEPAQENWKRARKASETTQYNALRQAVLDLEATFNP